MIQKILHARRGILATHHQLDGPSLNPCDDDQILGYRCIHFGDVFAQSTQFIRRILPYNEVLVLQCIAKASRFR
jgi:hypothetical protein